MSWEGKALDFRQLAIFLDHLGLVFELVPHDIERALQTLMQIGDLPFSLVHMGKGFQVENDFLDAIQPFFRFRQEIAQILTQISEVHFLLERSQCQQLRRITGEAGIELLAGIEQGQQVVHVTPESADIGSHITDRIVDLVRHAGGELADGSHFLRLQQLLLRFGQLLVGRLQIVDAPLLIELQLNVFQRQAGEIEHGGTLFAIALAKGRLVGRAVHAQGANHPFAQLERPA